MVSNDDGGGSIVGSLLGGRVKHAVLSNGGLFTDEDLSGISTDDSIVPHSTLVPQSDVSHHRGCRSDENVTGIELRLQLDFPIVGGNQSSMLTN